MRARTHTHVQESDQILYDRHTKFDRSPGHSKKARRCAFGTLGGNVWNFRQSLGPTIRGLFFDQIQIDSTSIFESQNWIRDVRMWLLEGPPVGPFLLLSFWLGWGGGNMTYKLCNNNNSAQREVLSRGPKQPEKHAPFPCEHENECFRTRKLKALTSVVVTE